MFFQCLLSTVIQINSTSMELLEKLANLKHNLSVSIRKLEVMESKDSARLNYEEVEGNPLL